MGEPKHPGLPVGGYRPQSQAAIDLVNDFKRAEEQLLRVLDRLPENPAVKVDGRWLAIGRTGLEQAFMAINRSIFRPERVELPGD